MTPAEAARILQTLADGQRAGSHEQITEAVRLGAHALTAGHYEQEAWSAAPGQATAQREREKRDEIAAQILQGFCANQAVFAANDRTGWGLVNCSFPDLYKMCIHMANEILAEMEHQPVELRSAALGAN